MNICSYFLALITVKTRITEQVDLEHAGWNLVKKGPYTKEHIQPKK